MPTVNDELQDSAIDNAVDIQQFGTGAVLAVLSILNRYDADLTAALMAALEQVPPESFTVERFEQVLGEVRRINAEAYAAAEAEIQRELEGMAEHQADWEYAALVAILPLLVQRRYPVQRVAPVPALSQALGEPIQGRTLTNWLADARNARITSIVNAVRTGTMDGLSVAEIIQKVRGTKAAKYADGVLQVARKNIETIIKTGITAIVESIKDAFWQNNSELVEAVQWVSVLDSRTSHYCQARAGKLYTPVTHKPIGHKVPWLQGPGALHWNAVSRGSMILTNEGARPIEEIQAGDLVMTHKGRFKPVTDARSKINKSGIIRVIRTESGRILRATDDHPVFCYGKGWTFSCALEVGDYLFSDSDELSKVSDIGGVIVSHPENRPSVIRQALVSILRSGELVTSSIDLDTDPDFWASEIDKASVNRVLSDPSIVKCESSLHYLFALSQLVAEFGAHRLCNLLALLKGDRSSSHDFGNSLIEPVSLFGGLNPALDFGVFGRVNSCHALGVPGKDRAVILGQSVSPMPFSGENFSSARFYIGNSLFGFAANGDIVFYGESGKSAVTESVIALNRAQGKAAIDMLINDERCVISEFSRHDKIVSIELQGFNDTVHDLAVQDDASYICNGIVVSNCRSSSTRVLKSWRQLGITGLSEQDRALMDGSNPQETTYAQWLSRQSAARQDQILGKERALLYRNGDLSFSQMFNQYGQWLTLEQLRQRNRI